MVSNMRRRLRVSCTAVHIFISDQRQQVFHACIHMIQISQQEFHEKALELCGGVHGGVDVVELGELATTLRERLESAFVSDEVVFCHNDLQASTWQFSPSLTFSFSPHVLAPSWTLLYSIPRHESRMMSGSL